MTYYADPCQRARLIAGLFDLAVFLEANPDVPAPRYTDMLAFPSEGADADRCAEIDAIAARIGAEAHHEYGHYVADRQFGPVHYRAVAIPHDHDAEGA
jgi:hypothetical protein